MAARRTNRNRPSDRGRRRAARGGGGDRKTRERDVLWVPLTLAVALALMALLPRVRESVYLTRSFFAASAGLLLWQVVLYRMLDGRGARRGFTVVLRPQHYLQAVIQLSVFAYWGWYWRPVYAMAWLLVGQIVFAYAFDMLLSWSRRETYVLGFGPFPIIFSINLFLWFRDDWFYLQFLLIGVGFLGKEFVRWNREGRRVHIFNPSAFSLGIFSVALIATGASDLTWGQEIASTLTLAPRIYAFLFLTGLVVMYFFSITLVAGTAAAVLFGLSAAYSAVTGVPYFVDSEIPAAVFLGLHLLVTDPSTSPRTPLGKAMFGALYGVGVFALYALLGLIGAPRFYDKLLCVPLLNLSVQGIDRFARALREHPLVARFRPGWSPARLNLAHMSAWAVFFLAMTGMGKTDGRHTGDSLPFWETACAEGRRNACNRLLELEATYCGDNAGWACNELGLHYTEGRLAAADPERAAEHFAHACELRFQPGCVNLLDPGGRVRAPPRALDLRLLLREGGRNLVSMPETELYRRACLHAWAFACGRRPS